MYRAIRMVSYMVQGGILASMGFGVNRWQYWAVILMTLTAIVATSLEKGNN